MLPTIHSVFIVGIKGVAMANIAVLLKKMGKKVTGSDTAEVFITDSLLSQNALTVSTGFALDDIPTDCDLVVYSAAHRGSKNLQVREAIKRAIPTVHQAHLLGQITASFKNLVAVCGCHGKTTTASLLAYSLLRLQKNPSYLVGAPFFNDYQGSDFLNTDLFIVEADEYALDPPADKTPKFNFLHPSHILCTNIDYDHPDAYKNLDETKEAFAKFLAGGHKLILNAADPVLASLFPRLRGKNYVTYGRQDATLTFSAITTSARTTTFTATYKNKTIGAFNLSLFGRMNVSNAAGVILTLLELGYNSSEIQTAIAGFTGAKRRFELMAKIGDKLLFDDYGHHPNEILATISAARDRFPNRRIVVIFQPHTYSRTTVFRREFERALATADASLVLPVFSSARETPEAHSVAPFSDHRLIQLTAKDDLTTILKELIRPHDVIFTMGAGDVYKLKDDIIRLLE
ncbi:UDP-N-acetylmuramate--L-alanine ligase [Candidatus Roizmanbacteria bacterium]|nr:UDP-N-acetylmuramate--L-alanine ligase [Candidatus Roizmanbacteria bacterium]